jgi:hypothetical protein
MGETPMPLCKGDRLGAKGICWTGPRRATGDVERRDGALVVRSPDLIDSRCLITLGGERIVQHSGLPALGGRWIVAARAAAELAR